MPDALQDESFLASSIHRSINGLMYCNLPEMVFEAGSRVRFHFMSLGDIADLHAPSMGKEERVKHHTSLS